MMNEQVKKLIVLNPDDERTISSLMLRVPVVVSPNKSLLELLNTFQTGKSHLALVRYTSNHTYCTRRVQTRTPSAGRACTHVAQFSVPKFVDWYVFRGVFPRRVDESRSRFSSLRHRGPAYIGVDDAVEGSAADSPGCSPRQKLPRSI